MPKKGGLGQFANFRGGLGNTMFMYKHKGPISRSTTMRAFVFLAKFIIPKYLKQEVNDDLSISMDECSPCGLSIAGDIKIYQCHEIKM